MAELLAQCGRSTLLILTNPSTSNKAPFSKSLSLPDGRFVKVSFVARDSPGLRCCSTNKANDLTISENRLNGLKYNPFQGTDTEIYTTNLYTGTGTTKVGTFDRDTTLASGTQSVTGIGFNP